MIKIKAHSILFAAALLLFSFNIHAQKLSKTAHIEWSAVNGANGYIIEIRQNDRIIVKKRVESNYYDARLSHGVYELRLSVLDSKKKIASRTSWRPLTIQSMKIVGNRYQYIAIGWAYVTLLPEWHDLLLDTSKTFHLYYNYELPIIKEFSFFSVEALLEYEDFDNREKSNKIEKTMSIWTFGPGLCFFHRFNPYLEATFHFDTGLAWSTLETDDRGTTGKMTSVDFFTLYALGIRGSYKYGFIEHGIDFKTVWYEEEKLREIRPFIRAGYRF